MVKIKVRARTVDMLGRQQIAGIPTAIHELLKNAYDAYAEHAEIDYFRKKNIMVLRDDGLGMTREQVEHRWLALGTESRLESNTEELHWTGPKALPRRSIMGEKGIGRLAIAAIAPMTLMMTRAIRPDGLQNLVVALVHWALFEQPGLDISSIDIPIVEIKDGGLPTKEDITQLVARIQQNLNELKPDLTAAAFENIREELLNLDLAPDRMYTALNRNAEVPLSPGGNGYGTTFVMLPTREELNRDIDGDSDQEASALEKCLLGFSNTMAGENPVIKTSFRDHISDDSFTERIAYKNFFMVDDQKNVDHAFKGDFDEYGQFRGTITIYGKDPIEYICNWPEGRGRQSRCGPFSVACNVIQGNDFESRLDKETHQHMFLKTNRIGGLYVYRDNIRILPYGDSDFDWLDIEKKRSKSAADWFFSYRRLWGYVSISHKSNKALSEKAGREGFRKNQAYHDFRALLTNLFERLAKEFFRKNAPQADTFWDQKKEYEDAKKALEKQRKSTKVRRDQFGRELELFFEQHESGAFEARSKKIAEDGINKLQEIEMIEDKGELAQALQKLELDTRTHFRELDRALTLTKPRGLSLGKRLESYWEAYNRIAQNLKARLIEEVWNGLQQKHLDVLKDRVSNAMRRESAILILEDERNQIIKELASSRRKVYQATEALQKELKKSLKNEFTRITPKLDSFLVDFIRQSAEEPQAVSGLQTILEHQQKIKNELMAFLEAIHLNMEALSKGIQEGHTQIDTTGALEQETVRLEEKLAFYQGFANIGMGLGILQHEFEKSANDFRASMHELKPWADSNPSLYPIYRKMRHSFEHLDQYLKMLDPLGRRVTRTKIEINGDTIYTYLWRIFEDQMKKEDITLTVTPAFSQFTVHCFLAPLLAAFVNIVDNAVYWVGRTAVDQRIIRLDSDDRGFLISNSGQGIEECDRDLIFEFGESRKPGGRGMGLAISREALRKEGFDLELIQCGRQVPPVFRISVVANENIVEG